MTTSKRDLQIKLFYLGGHSIRETARRFGLSLQRIHQILRRDAPGVIRARYDTRSNSTGLTSAQRAALTSTDGANR